MTDRRSLAHLRSPSRDMVAVSVAMHRQTPAGPRQIGWAVRADGDQSLFVLVADDGNGWRWTGARRDATQFISKARADIWIGRNLNGAARSVAARA